MSWGVIRNQRPKIHRFRLVSTVGVPFRKISNIDCRVIQHARFNIHQKNVQIGLQQSLQSESVALARTSEISCIVKSQYLISIANSIKNQAIKTNVKTLTVSLQFNTIFKHKDALLLMFSRNIGLKMVERTRCTDGTDGEGKLPVPVQEETILMNKDKATHAH